MLSQTSGDTRATTSGVGWQRTVDPIGAVPSKFSTDRYGICAQKSCRVHD
jgi:hypothetical protein